MGINDPNPYRSPHQPGITLRGPRSLLVTLILINIAAWLANGLFTERPVFFGHFGTVTNTLALQHDVLQKPWLWWKFLTCGFAHAPGYRHILFNMLGLWFLGRFVEARYGRWEFLWMYLLMIVLGSVIWAVSSAIFDPDKPYVLLGASGAVSGVIVLFILNFPNVTLILFPIPIPIKAWFLGILLVGYNVYGALPGNAEKMGNTAFSVHLVGMVFAFFYVTFHWNICGLFRRSSRRPAISEQTPRLRDESPRHTCTICGVTNLDDPKARFRYCSKCEGLCYCSEHIQDHEHVTREKALEE